MKIKANHIDQHIAKQFRTGEQLKIGFNYLSLFSKMASPFSFLKKAKIQIGVFVFMGLLSFSLLANEPWFAGPFFVPAGRTYPKDHTQLRITSVFMDDPTTIDRGPIVVESPGRFSNQYIALAKHGLTDRLDLTLALPYVTNKQLSEQGRGIGDFHVLFGYQVIEPRINSAWPYLRLMVQETIPTGRYDQLRPKGLRTDSTGRGSYRTQVSLNFESMLQPLPDHFLRSRLTLGYLVGTSIWVDGLNHYGGTIDTHGRVYPGYRKTAGVSFEYSLTQHWVPLIEVLYSFSSASHFIGTPGKTLTGSPAKMSRSSQSEVSYLPGIEYNFSKTYGIVAGYWFSLNKRQTTGLKAYTIALNAKW